MASKPPTHKYRARWASVHKIHSLFADGFPELEQRYVRERDAAERVLGCFAAFASASSGIVA